MTTRKSPQEEFAAATIVLPMAEAPMDGTPIVARNRKGEIAHIRWSPRREFIHRQSHFARRETITIPPHSQQVVICERWPECQCVDDCSDTIAMRSPIVKRCLQHTLEPDEKPYWGRWDTDIKFEPVAWVPTEWTIMDVLEVYG